jgi:fimbrial chaperone protein
MAGALLLTMATQAVGGAFAVAPIRVELRPGQGAAELTVHNETDAATLIQVRAVSWSQQDGAEQFADTRELLITPPVFTLPANGEQIIRLALRRKPDPAHELSYRIFVQEVPAAAAPDARQLTVALRISLPVFVQPASTRPDLQWTSKWLPDGRLELDASNQGGMHLQITDFDVDFGAGVVLNATRTSKYVLNGSHASWTVTVPDSVDRNAVISVRGHSDQGEFVARVAHSAS